VKAETLVPGDLIKVNMGGKLPADIRLVEASQDLLANNSSLTGESEPQERSVDAGGHDQPMEAQNLCFFGTQIVQGNCTGVVINTADHTMMGRIAALADDTVTLETPLQHEIKIFIHKIALVSGTQRGGNRATGFHLITRGNIECCFAYIQSAALSFALCF
jgi:sodium/potassium-transporting ATPase subunit alpha